MASECSIRITAASHRLLRLAESFHTAVAHFSPQAVGFRRRWRATCTSDRASPEMSTSEESFVSRQRQASIHPRRLTSSK